MMNKCQRQPSKPRLRVASPTARSQPQLLQHNQSFKQLQQQNTSLQKKLQLKVHKIKQLKDTLSSLSKENADTHNIPTPRAAQQMKKETVEGIIQAQEITKNTLEGFRRLEQQFSDYRKEASYKIESLETQLATCEEENARLHRSMKLSQEQMRSRQRMEMLEWKSRASQLQEELSLCLRGKEQLEVRVEQMKGQITSLKQENLSIKNELLTTRSFAQAKEQQYRTNLGQITQRLDHLRSASSDIDAASQLQLLQERYAALLEKYTRKKLRTRQMNRQWKTVTEQLLLRCRQHEAFP